MCFYRVFPDFLYKRLFPSEIIILAERKEFFTEYALPTYIVSLQFLAALLFVCQSQPKGHYKLKICFHRNSSTLQNNSVIMGSFVSFSRFTADTKFSTALSEFNSFFIVVVNNSGSSFSILRT